MKTLIAFLLLCTTAFAEDTRVLVINDSGHYLMIAPTSGAPRFEKFEVVLDVRTGSTPTDPPTNPPTADPIVQEAHDMAAAIGSKRDAEIVAALYAKFSEMLSDGTIDRDGYNTAWAMSRLIVVNRLEHKGSWASSLDILDNKAKASADLGKYMSKISQGFAKYAGVEQSQLLSESRQDITGIEIMAIINAIMELLRLLGVFNK